MTEVEPVAFQYEFGLTAEGKAADTVTVLEDGDLLIEGWAANFEGVDRQGENFTDGAFKRGIDTFLNGNASLNYHHKSDHGIGRVLELEEVEGKGLYMKARVDKQEPSSPLHYIYNGVRKGTYSGLSVGGFFNRKLTADGWKIDGCDFTEISVTPVPVHPHGTKFAVVAGKALADLQVPEVPAVDGEIRAEDEADINYHLERLNSLFDRILKRGDGQDPSRVDNLSY